MTAPDLRALVRARMLALGIKQAALAARLAPRWGVSHDSAVRRLSRWQTRAADITSDPLADVLAELGGSLAWDAAPSAPPADAPAPARRASKRPPA